jgi:hypothetical protein
VRFFSLAFVLFVSLLILGCTSAPAQQAQTTNQPIKTYECPDGTIVTNLADCQKTASNPPSQEVVNPVSPSPSGAPVLSKLSCDQKDCAKISDTKLRDDCYFELGVSKNRGKEQSSCCLYLTNASQQLKCLRKYGRGGAWYEYYEFIAYKDKDDAGALCFTIDQTMTVGEACNKTHPNDYRWCITAFEKPAEFMTLREECFMAYYSSFSHGGFQLNCDLFKTQKEKDDCYLHKSQT